MATDIAPLNSAERSQLRVCEQTIEKHLGTFVEVGNALAKIRDGQLYRETHKTFDAYVKQKWDFTSNYAWKLIAAADVVENVYNCTQKPTSEGQARPLAELQPEQQVQAWTAAVEKAKEAGKPVTAKLVAEAVAEIATPWKCPNCGHDTRNAEGECAKCLEPPQEPQKRGKGVRSKAASPADIAKAQVKVWADTIGRWLGKSPSIDEYRGSFPGKQGDAVVKLATDLFEALKTWQRVIR